MKRSKKEKASWRVFRRFGTVSLLPLTFREHQPNILISNNSVLEIK